MKNLFKISLLSLCLLTIPTAAIYSNNDTNFLQTEEHPQIEPTVSIESYIYTVLIYTGGGLLPKYIDQFEFEAGDVLRVSSRTEGELTGNWQETDLLVLSFFNAQVESPDVTTTTTIAASTTQNIRESQAAEFQGSKWLINLSGISSEITIPPPFDINLSTIMGTGAYLGADVFFIGFSGISEEPEFGSINPETATQCQTNIDAEIIGRNTRFLDKTINIDFSNNGVSTKEIVVSSNTKLKFKIDVDCNAEVGTGNVTVDYEDDVIVGEDVFTVQEDVATSTTTTATQ